MSYDILSPVITRWILGGLANRVTLFTMDDDVLNGGGAYQRVLPPSHLQSKSFRKQFVLRNVHWGKL